MTETPVFDPITIRAAEVAQYEANIAMYTAIAAALPSVWPEHLAYLKGSKTQHESIIAVDDLDEVALIGDLWAHDAAQAAIRAETVELAKAKAILAFLEAQA